MCERFQTERLIRDQTAGGGHPAGPAALLLHGAKRANSRTHFGRDLESNSIVSPRHWDKLGVHRFAATWSLMPKTQCL
jgi:hypothetical protein